MNINDLPKGSYKIISGGSSGSSAPLNVNNLPQGSISPAPAPAPSQPSNSFPTEAPPEIHQSFMQRLGGLLGKAAHGVEHYAEDIGHDYMQGAKTIVGNYGGAANYVSNKLGLGSAFQSLPQKKPVDALVQNAGEVAKAAMSPITHAVVPFVQSAANTIASDSSGDFQKLADSKVGDFLTGSTSSAAQFYQSWADKHPEAAKNLEAGINVAGLIGAGEGEGAVKEGLSDAVKSAAESTKSGLSKAVSTAGDVVSNVADKTIGESAAKSAATKVDNALNSHVWDMIQPKLTPTELEKAVKNGDVMKSGLLGELKLVPDQELIDVAKPFVAAAKDPMTAVQNMKQGIVDEANALREGLKQSDSIWNRNVLKGTINAIEKPHLLSGDLEKAFDKTMAVVLDKAKTVPKTLDGLLDVRQHLDQVVADQYPNLYSSETLSPIKQAIIKTRNAINGLIERKLPDGVTADGTSFRDSLRKQSLLYDAIDNAASKTGKLGSNMIDRFAKQNPKTWKAIKTGAGLIGAGEIIKHAPIP